MFVRYDDGSFSVDYADGTTENYDRYGNLEESWNSNDYTYVPEVYDDNGWGWVTPDLDGDYNPWVEGDNGAWYYDVYGDDGIMDDDHDYWDGYDYDLDLDDLVGVDVDDDIWW